MVECKESRTALIATRSYPYLMGSRSAHRMLAVETVARILSLFWSLAPGPYEVISLYAHMPRTRYASPLDVHGRGMCVVVGIVALCTGVRERRERRGGSGIVQSDGQKATGAGERRLGWQGRRCHVGETTG